MFDPPFYAKGLHFTCQRCSGCCRHDPGFVNLSEKDLEKLLKWANVDRESFINSWCRWVDKQDGFEYLCLTEKDNFDCIFWDKGCTVYENRPLQCSAYPFWHALVLDEDWWNAGAADCPGMNSGALHPAEEIQQRLDQRRSEPYIRRKQGEK